jgi:hypothetical protein
VRHHESARFALDSRQIEEWPESDKWKSSMEINGQINVVYKTSNAEKVASEHSFN